VVRDGRVIARAHNTVLRDSDPSAHAEVNAVRAACAALGSHDLSRCIVYATGEPCPMCLGCCYWAHVSRIVFGSSLADSEAIGFGELPYAPATLLQGATRPLLVEGGVLRDECLASSELARRGGRDTLDLRTELRPCNLSPPWRVDGVKEGYHEARGCGRDRCRACGPGERSLGREIGAVGGGL
jgi:guanine deaminase